jgi:hypothetical protein
VESGRPFVLETADKVQPLSPLLPEEIDRASSVSFAFPDGMSFVFTACPWHFPP